MTATVADTVAAEAATKPFTVAVQLARREPVAYAIALGCWVLWNVLPIPAGLLKPGRNVVRFEQAGIASDPKYLDDLGILGDALEFTTAAAPR